MRGDVVDGLPDGRDLLGILVRDLDPELVLELHDELDEVERVGVQVVLERRLFGDLILFDSELLRQNFFHTLEDFFTRRCHVSSSRNASSSSRIVPSSSLSAMLPVKPSATTTSAAPRSRSRDSALPPKFKRLSSLSSRCASSVSRFPFSSSSPIERRRTSGLTTSSSSSPKTAPMCANWRRCSGRLSAFAPASIRTDGPRRVGIGTAIAGRI